jgi:cytoskeletal protein CcmA (bactofilin family)
MNRINIVKDSILTDNFSGSVSIEGKLEVDIDGDVSGNVYVSEGSIVCVNGRIGGNIFNNGASLYVHGLVEGQIFTKKGMTQINFDAEVHNKIF